MKLIATGTIGVILIGVANSGFGMMANNAEFHTLSECLAGIQKSSGQKLRVVIDTPDKVAGFLANEQYFACEKETSGTKGVYFKGVYMTDN